MFERFTGEARTVVAGAQDEARTLRDPFIGPEHMLLAMVSHDSVGGELLRGHDVTADALRQRLRDDEGPDSRLDPEALASLGIDLNAVRLAAETQFGPGALAPHARPMPHGHIPFSPTAKKVLELAVREAVADTSTSINSAHLLLGLLADKRAVALLDDHGVDVHVLGAQAAARSAA